MPCTHFYRTCILHSLIPQVYDVFRVSQLITFGDMELSDKPPYNLSTSVIDVFQPDRYNPGSFIFNKLSAIYRYTEGVGLTLIAGSPTERGLREGPALQSRFNLIVDILQHKKDKMAIVDYRNHCIREINLATSQVRTLIGSCHLFSNNVAEFLRLETADQNVSARADIMNHPLRAVYVEKGDYYIFFDRYLNNLLKMDVQTDTAACLNAELNKRDLHNIVDIIVDSKDKYLYVTHGYALSRIDLDTLGIELLTGVNVNDKGFTPKDFKTGPFSTAYVGRLNSMTWVIPDRVIAAITTLTDEVIALIDVKNREIRRICPGKLK